MLPEIIMEILQNRQSRKQLLKQGNETEWGGGDLHLSPSPPWQASERGSCISNSLWSWRLHRNLSPSILTGKLLHFMIPCYFQVQIYNFSISKLEKDKPNHELLQETDDQTHIQLEFFLSWDDPQELLHKFR